MTTLQAAHGFVSRAAFSRGISTSSAKPVFVVAGIGKGMGTGAASAREFLRAGYRVAILGRDDDAVHRLAHGLGNEGDAGGFSVKAYDYSAMRTAFADIRQRWPEAPLRVALWNVGEFVRGPFLDVTEQDVRRAVDTNIVGPFAFAREAILAFQDQALDNVGKRGALIFTSATSAVRGNKTTSVFSAGKFALRSLSQSLAKEFGPQNIHVSTAIIDGGILTDRAGGRADYNQWSQNEDVRLSPEAIAKSYLYLANQDRSAWTWELDLRPAHESW